MTGTKKLDHAFAGHRDDANPHFDDELAFALSSIRYIREHAPTAPKLANKHRRHLDLMDGIALLLVTDDQADVAAVSLMQTSTSINFYYAKNRPCTDVETQYVETLLKMIESYDPSKRHECKWDILQTAVQMCIRKVRNRIRKISMELAKSGLTDSTLSNLSNLPIWQTTGNPEGTIAKAIATAYSIPECRKLPPDRELLAHYFSIVRTMNVSVDALRKDISRLMEFVMIICERSPGRASIGRRWKSLRIFAMCDKDNRARNLP
jgi:hypothetical protein